MRRPQHFCRWRLLFPINGVRDDRMTGEQARQALDCQRESGTLRTPKRTWQRCLHRVVGWLSSVIERPAVGYRCVCIAGMHQLSERGDGRCHIKRDNSALTPRNRNRQWVGRHAGDACAMVGHVRPRGGDGDAGPYRAARRSACSSQLRQRALSGESIQN